MVNRCSNARENGAPLFSFHLPEELPAHRSVAPMHGCGNAGSVPRYLRPLPIVARCCPRCPNRSPPLPSVSGDFPNQPPSPVWPTPSFPPRFASPARSLSDNNHSMGRPRHQDFGGQIMRHGQTAKTSSFGTTKTYQDLGRCIKAWTAKTWAPWAATCRAWCRAQDRPPRHQGLGHPRQRRLGRPV